MAGLVEQGRVKGVRVPCAIDFAFLDTSIEDLKGRVLDAALAFYRPGLSDCSERNEELEQLKIDICQCIDRFGCTPAEYFWYGFDRRDDADRADYMLAIEAKSILNSYAPLEAYDYCDKLFLHSKLEPCFKRALVDCGIDREAVLDFALTHDRFVVKALGANCGTGIWFVDCGTTCVQTAVREALQEIPEGTHLFVEEMLGQSETQAALNPDSVNTVRVATFFDGCDVRVVYANQRMGRAGSALDNVSAGGIGAGICLETGVVETPGVDKFGGRYAVHPDNGCAIVGHQVPEWGQLLEDVRGMAVQLPANTYVGWDLAHSDDKGWSLVEANFVPGFFVEQVAYDKGSRPRFLSLFENARPNDFA